jgi:D-arabinose 1-dehydrogenase-like Zn-dependent alcohol dehydrogenase
VARLGKWLRRRRCPNRCDISEPGANVVVVGLGGIGLNGTAFGGARGRTDVPKIVDWYLDGRINIDDLITHVLPLERINEGFDLMHEGTVPYSGSYSSRRIVGCCIWQIFGSRFATRRYWTTPTSGVRTDD